MEENQKKPIIKKSIQLFFYSLYISLFTFGGGFVIISFMSKIYIHKLKWLTEAEMLDIVTLAQTIPGAVAVNASVLTGYKLNGVFGALAAVLGILIPPLVVISLLYLVYDRIIDLAYVTAIMKGMQAGITAIICDVILKLGTVVKREKNKLAYFIIPVAFVCSFFLKVNAVFIILPCIALGVAVGIIEERRRKRIVEEEVQ